MRDRAIYVARQRRRRLGVAAAILLITLVIAAIAYSSLAGHFSPPQRYTAKMHHSQARITLPVATPIIAPVEGLQPLTEEEAAVQNAKIPFSILPVERPFPLTFPMEGPSYAGWHTAIECLSAAIYYEGGNEPVQGKRGIAQVVINRARHPAFPNSICNVVYEGAERKTGCQFTFTCDGSLSRKPKPGPWAAAQKVAIDALSGKTEPTVGMATHYHADYVLPYWAPSLIKITKIGTHIFYRWKGNWGRRISFSQMVSPGEWQLASDGQNIFSNDTILEETLAAPADILDTNTNILLSSQRPLADNSFGNMIRAEAQTSSLPDTQSPVPDAPAPIIADDKAGILKNDGSQSELKNE